MKINENVLRQHTCDDMQDKAEGVVRYVLRDDLIYRIIAGCEGVNAEVSKATRFFMRCKVDNFTTVAEARDRIQALCHAVGEALCNYDLMLAASGLCADDDHLNSIMASYCMEWNSLVNQAVRNGMPRDYKAYSNEIFCLKRPAFADKKDGENK